VCVRVRTSVRSIQSCTLSPVGHKPPTVCLVPRSSFGGRPLLVHCSFIFSAIASWVTLVSQATSTLLARFALSSSSTSATAPLSNGKIAWGAHCPSHHLKWSVRRTFRPHLFNPNHQPHLSLHIHDIPNSAIPTKPLPPRSKNSVQ